ncbi:MULTISPECIES: NAD(P)H-binding protein [unclassified Rhizobium]|uniref:NAD(P)H-binding protein n=1 Tax=unclassified Rhizobium TaxID=2613769 RepID=UPI000CDF4F75|nr:MULTISPECIES: NAD(P)H-binding protein [Rhizobium]AVA19905.1 NAD-dependent nucleoside-diphosphate-sugar epimerase protein [Rhizobium sp. NXC24]MDK4740972.1 NAD(P)H-binding protein [Rhizobium sp. CNPSo 3464]UWU21220.1 NAD(P)H-binding protein [Rhizobium tropici]
MFVILGATGKIGRATIAELRRQGAPVRAVVRRQNSADDLSAMGCDVAIADIQDSAALSESMRGATAVQIICPTSVQADDAAAEMKNSIRTIVDALDRNRPSSVLAISDYGAHLASDTGITLIFHHLESELKKLPAALTFLRSAEHMQNWSRQIGRAIETGVLPSRHHPVTKLFPTVSAPDVGVIAGELLLSGTQAPLSIIHAEGPDRYSVEDVARIAGELAGRKIIASEMPRLDWIPALVRGGISASYAELVAELYDAHNAGRIDAEPGVGDIRRGRTGLREVLTSMMKSL